MIRVSILCLLAASSLAAETPAPTSAPNRRIVRVPMATSVIQEKSLAPDASLTRDNTVAGMPAMLSADQAVRSMKGISEAGSPIQDNNMERPSASTFYALMLEPGEELEVRLSCEDHGKVYLQWVPGLKVTPMTHQFRRANTAPKPLRSSRISVKNVLREPTEVILAALGAPNYAYTLTLMRRSG